tara:strand:+ start:1677 stop:2309 length:633 start_codon:yes stop_codon:yes gene_type:complete
MRTEAEILQHFQETDDEVVERTLAWVLEATDNNCPMCSNPAHRTWEVKLMTGQMTTMALETSNNWPSGTIQDHMDNHRRYDHAEAAVMEQARNDSISTLSVAEGIAQKLIIWIEELEVRKDDEGITSEWVADAARLTNQANQSLRLIGQLKKEIGVDSQLLLAQNRVDSIMGVLVHVLGDKPDLLDMVELQLAALKEPTHIIDVDESEWV